jgi:RNA polymerase sigma factor (sigma-70 family)
MKAHRALAMTRPHKMWPWLATIAANVCTDIIRKRARVVYLDVQRTPSSSDPEQDDAAAELRAQILVKAMDGLPRSYRELIRDHEYRKLSYREMASRHQMSVGAVGSTLLRARRALARQVKQTARSRGQWPLPAVLVARMPRRRSAWKANPWKRSLVREPYAQIALDIAGHLGAVQQMAVAVAAAVFALPLVFHTDPQKIPAAAAQEQAWVASAGPSSATPSHESSRTPKRRPPPPHIGSKLVIPSAPHLDVPKPPAVPQVWSLETPDDLVLLLKELMSAAVPAQT